MIDEAHCLVSWGESEFRPAYQKLGLLRAVLREANILALTATATLSTQKQIIASLRMEKPATILESPDRLIIQ